MAEGHDASAFEKEHCVICKLGFENKEPVHVSKKGMLTIMKCCEKHGRDDLYTYLCQSADPVAVLVRSDCRRNFIDKKRHLKVMLQMVLKRQAQRSCGPV